MSSTEKGNAAAQAEALHSCSSAAPSAVVPYIGVDFGSRTTRIARLFPEKPMPTIIRNTLSNEATATVACFPDDGESGRSYGENAAPKAVTKAKQTVLDMVEWMLEASEGSNTGESGYRSIGTQRLHPVQVVGYYLKSLLQLSATREIQENTEKLTEFLSGLRLCIAVSPTTPDIARRAYCEACVVAGLKEANVQMVGADEAVAMYFHHHQLQHLAESQNNVIIINIGASASFATLLSASPERVEKVLTVSKPTGTQRIDEGIVSHVLWDFSSKHPEVGRIEDLREDLKVMRKLHRECCKAKEILSTTDETRVQLDAIKSDADLNTVVTKSLLEALAEPFVAELRDMLEPLRKKAAELVDAGEGSDAGVRVEVIGGGWRIPCVMAAIKQACGVERLGTALDANLAVAEGSAILAFLSLHTAGDAERFMKEKPHCVTALNFHSIPQPGRIALTDAERAAVDLWMTAEEAACGRDEKIRLHLVALNQLDSLVLQTLAVLDVCEMSAEQRKAAKQYLMDCDDSVRVEGEGKSTAELEQQLEEVQAHLARQFPEIEAYYVAKKEEEERKEAELARLSREKKEEETDPKSDPQRLRLAQKRREQGAALFKQECWAEAQTRFVQALSVLGQLYDTTSEENKTKKAEIALSCHLNIASCSVRLGIWRNAINNSTSALEIAPENPKAYFRRGQAYVGLKEYAEAVKDLEKASVLSKQDAMVQVELGRARQALEVQKAKEKKMYSKMFS